MISISLNSCFNNTDATSSEKSEILTKTRKSKDKQQAKSHYKQGISYRKNKEFDKAIEEFDKAIKLNPDFVRAYIERGITKSGIKDENGLVNYESAQADLKRAEKLLQSKDDPEASELLSLSIKSIEQDIYFQNQKIKRLGREGERLIAIGNKFRRKGYYKKAIENFSEAINIIPTYSNAYNVRGLAYCSQDNYQAAFDDFQTALDILKSGQAFVNVDKRLLEAWIYFNRGTCYSSQKNAEKALENYNIALNLFKEIGEIDMVIRAQESIALVEANWDTSKALKILREKR